MALPFHISREPLLEWFVSHCHRRRYPAKSTLIYAGDKADALYFLISGSVSVVIEDVDGKELVLAYLFYYSNLANEAITWSAALYPATLSN